MQALVDKEQAIEDIAAHFFVTPAVVRQRLKLASVSPTLLDIYGEDRMSLELLMAFTVAYDEERQLQVWEMLADAHVPSPSWVRRKLTANRPEERRVGKEGVSPCRSRCAPYPNNTKTST